MNINIVELVGYIGSLLVVVSMLMTSVIKLRFINLTGSFIFTIYALIIKSYPTALMNFSLVIINIYNLYRLLKVQKDYSVIPVSADEAFYQYFLNRFEKNIRRFFPNFDKNAAYSRMYMICCKTDAAGILIGNDGEEGEINVAVDYATPAYRDCSAGKHLYRYLEERGLTKLTVADCSFWHRSYLRHMGFKRDGKVWKRG